MPKPFLKASALSFLLAFVVVVRAQEIPADELYRRVLPSVVTLNVEKSDGTSGVGSAFLAIKDGLALTSWHLVKGAKRVNAKFSTGEEFEVSGLVDKDEKRDIALVKVKVFGRPMLPIALLEPPVGSKAYVIGAPLGLEFTVTDGLISQTRTLDGTKQLQFSAAVSTGNSGSPLLTNGEVAGIVSWQFREGQNLNFAVSGLYALDLDSSLPTRPWSDIVSTELVQSPVTTASPREALSAAKTIFVRQNQGNPELQVTVEKELLKWKKYSVVARLDSADLVLDLSPTADVNLWAGKGAKAVAILSTRDGLRLWSVVKGGDWSMAGYSFPKVGRAIVEDLRKYVVQMR